jgi:hypothetical protein
MEGKEEAGGKPTHATALQRVHLHQGGPTAHCCLGVLLPGVGPLPKGGDVLAPLRGVIVLVLLPLLLLLLHIRPNVVACPRVPGWWWGVVVEEEEG